MTSAEVHPSDVVLPPGEPIAEPGPVAIAAAATDAVPMFRLSVVAVTRNDMHRWVPEGAAFKAVDFNKVVDDLLGDFKRTGGPAYNTEADGLCVLMMPHIQNFYFAMIPAVDIPA